MAARSGYDLVKVEAHARALLNKAIAIAVMEFGYSYEVAIRQMIFDILRSMRAGAKISPKLREVIRKRSDTSFRIRKEIRKTKSGGTRVIRRRIPIVYEKVKMYRRDGSAYWLHLPPVKRKTEKAEKLRKQLKLIKRRGLLKLTWGKIMAKTNMKFDESSVPVTDPKTVQIAGERAEVLSETSPELLQAPKKKVMRSFELARNENIQKVLKYAIRLLLRYARKRSPSLSMTIANKVVKSYMFKAEKKIGRLFKKFEKQMEVKTEIPVMGKG